MICVRAFGTVLDIKVSETQWKEEEQEERKGRGT